MMVLAAVLQIGRPPQAATVYWDINGSAAGASGAATANGVWDGVNAFWNNAAGTGTAAAWNAGDTAVFSAGSNATGVSTITVSGTQMIGGLVIEEGTVSLGGGTLQLAQNATISVAAGLVTTLASDLGGAFSLTKSGGGTLDYQGNGSGFTGAVVVRGGTLKLSGSGVLTGAAGVTLASRGVLTLDNTAVNLGDRIAANGLTSNGGTLNFTHGGAAGTNYAEALGALTLNGALTINTAQAASGQTSILTFSALTRNTGGVLYLNGAGLGGTTRNQVIFTAAPALTNGLLPYAVVSNGTVTRIATHGGAGTPLVPQTAGYTAGQASWLSNVINALPTADQNLSGTRQAYTLTLDNGIDIEAGATGSTDRLFTIGDGVTGMVLQTGGSSEIRNRSGTTAEPVLDFGTAEGIFHTLGDLTLVTSGGHNVRGSNGFIKSGPGTLTLQINANTGIMRLNEGIYRVTGSSTSGLGGAASGWEFNGGGLTLAHTAGVNYVSAGPMTMNADTTITVDRSASGAGVVYQMPGALTIGSQVLTVLKGGLITADSAYGLNLSNTAVGMTLSGSPTFHIDNNGASAGTLTVGNVNSSGGLHTIRKSGTGNLITSGTTGFQNAVEIAGGQIGWSNNTAATSITESHVISGMGGVVKSGSSLVRLTGVNTFSGTTTLTGGALQAADGTGLPAASNLLFNGGVYQTSGTFNRGLGAGAGAGEVRWAADASGGFAASGGALTVTLAGAPNPLQWDTPFFVSGAGALSFGSVSADDVVVFTHNLDLNPTATALARTFSVVDNTTSTADKAVLSGVLSNSNAAGGLTKTGNGTLELQGLNTFAGPVVLTAGTLQFATVTNSGGAASNLGRGTDFTLGGRLQFIGAASQSTNRPMTLTATTTLDASGTGGSTITYEGAITGAGFGLVLDGAGNGFLNGALTQTGTAADLTKTGAGTWTLNAPATLGDDLIVNNGTFNINATPTLADEFTISGTGTVINVNAVLNVGDDIVINTGATINLNVAAVFAGDDFYVRGGTVKLGVDGAIPNTMDNLLLSFDVATGAVLDINGTTGSLPNDIFIGNGTLSGSIIDSVGTGSISATNTFTFGNGNSYVTLIGATTQLVKNSSGTATAYGAHTFGGAATLNDGMMILDYTLNNSSKLASAAALNMAGGSLTIIGSNTAPTTQTVSSLPVTGSGRVLVNNGTGQTATLVVGAITRAAVGDGMIDFTVSSANAVIQTTSTNTAGPLLGGWATYGGNRFATVSGGTLQAAASVAANDVSTWAAGDHVLGSTGFTGTTGSRTIGSLIFDAAAASTVTIAPAGRLNIATGGILVSSATGANVASITGGTLVSGTGGELLVHQHNTGSDFVIGSTLSGTTLLTKGGPGTLSLTGRNFHSGQTTILDGTVKVSGGDAIGDRSLVELRAVSTAVLDLSDGSETIGGLTGGSSAGGTVAIGTGTLTLNPSVTQVYSGFLTGTGTLVKTGGNSQELEGANPGFSGRVIVNQGLLHLDAGAGALPNVLDYTISGPTASLLSDQDGDDDIGRISNSAVITLNNTAGSNGLRIRNSNDQGETRTETIGSLVLGAGHNVLMAEASNTTANTVARLNVSGTLTRNNQATVLVRGLSLGAASGIRGQITFTTALTGAIGGTGAAVTNFSIFPYMVGDATTSVALGNSFVTLDATTGLRPLNTTTEYVLDAAGYDALGGVSDHNVRFAANPAATLAAGKTINSLVIDSTAAAITLTGGAAESLTLASGALLASTNTPANASRITGFASLLTGTTEYVIYTTNATHTLTINSALATTGAGLTKSGAGTLVLANAVNTYGGGTWFNQGLVEAAALDSLGTGPLNFFGGGLRWGTGSTFDISGRVVTLNVGGGTLDTNGSNVVLAAAIGNGGTGGLTKAGAGSLTLNAVVNYTGDTAITGGTLIYGVAGALPATSAVTMGGGTLDIGAHATTLKSLVVTGDSAVAGSAALVITGDVVNSGGSRVLTLGNSGGVSFTGTHLLLTDSTTTGTLTLAGAADVSINGVIADNGSTGGLTYAGTGTLTLGSSNLYNGLTGIDSGAVVVTADQNLLGGLRFGSATSVTTAATLNLTSVNATFGGVLTVQTNSATANSIIIGPGKTLTVNNNVSISNATDGATTALNMTGGGAFVVNGASFTVGANSGTSNSSRSFLDMSALGSFTANLTGTFAVQLTGDNNPADSSSLVLSNGPNSITAATVAVGPSATGGVQTLTLGAGANVLNANTFNIGTGTRDSGILTFGPGSAGSVVIRDTAGTGRATFNMGTGSSTTGVAGSNLFDVAGHNADLLLGVVSIGTQAGRTSALTNVFSFDQGTLDMTSLNLGSKGSAGSTLTTATFNIGGGTVRSGPITMATTTTATGTVVAGLNITGGDITVSGSILKGAGPGNDTANFLLSGNTTVLDMGGFTLGGTGDARLDSVVIAGGTLKNLGQFNDGAVLVKTTSGILTMDGSNTYTGATDAQEGRIIAVGGANNRLSTAGLSLGAGTASAVLQLGTAAGSSDQVLGSLVTVGTGTGNAIVGGNAAFSTLTLNQGANATFNGRLGGMGANENNLHLVKNDAGDLVIGGAATLAGTVTVNSGKLFLDGFAGAATTLTSLMVADGTEFSLRGTSASTQSVYSFSGTGNVITVGGGAGATLGFALDGAYNTQLNLAAGQTLQLNGTLTTAIYVNGTPNAGQQYVLINGADDGSIFASGTFNLNPVVFNGGSFTYTLGQITAGAGEKWVLTPAAQAAAADVWWKGDLTGIGTGVWSASTTTGSGFPTNWDTSQTGGVDALVPPDSGSIVHFSANGAGSFDTTLGASLTIQELIFHAGGTAITIGSSGGTNTLTLGNTVDASGLTLQAGAPNVSFSANIALAQPQAWNIVDSGTTLTLAGEVSGGGPLSLNANGAAYGRIAVTGPGGRLTYSGGTSLVAGWLVLEGGADDRMPLSGPLVMGNATQAALLQLGDPVNGVSNNTIGSLSSSTTGSAIIGGAPNVSTLTVNQGGAGIFHGLIGGLDADQNNVALVKTGAATLELNNVNTYIGSTTVRQGVLQLGAAGGITQSASLAVSANAGATAVFDLKGRNATVVGGITLGGADSLASSRIVDTATGGLLTFGGNILFDPANGPLGASITSSLHLGFGTTTRTFTADDSASAATDLTITGNITTDGALTTTGIALSLLGTGQGLLVGNITLVGGSTDGTTTDLTKSGVGTWTYQGVLTAVDDLLISGGTLNLLAGTQIMVDDIVADNAGVILNIFGDGTNPVLIGTSGLSNGLYARSGAVINILSDNVAGPLMDFIILGDNDQGLGTLNLGDKTLFMPRLDIGFDSTGEIGVITGTGSINGLATLNLNNGSITASLNGVGNIIKDNHAVTLTGSNALTGTTVVRGGSLVLDFATNNGADSKIGTGNLTFGVTAVTSPRAVLSLLGNSTAASLQTVGALAVAAGPSQIDLTAAGGQDMTLRITGTITRTAGTLNLNLPDANTKIEYTGPSGNVNGIVGGWMTLNDRDFVTISGGQFQAAAYTVQNNASLWRTNANITNSGGGFTGTVAVDCATINSLRFNAAAVSTITVGGTLVLASGAILETAGVGASASTIAGGSLVSDTGNFIIHQNNTAGLLTIASNLLGGSSITKNGPGTLLLSGTNITGNVFIEEGILRISGGRAISDTASVNIRNVPGAGLELLAAQTETVGALVGGTGSALILNTGAVLTVTQNSDQTFAGVISGAGGLTKTGNSILTLTGVSTTTGTLRIEAGQVTLSGGSAQLASITAIILSGTGSLLDTQDPTGTSINRINNNAAITLNNTAAGSGFVLNDTQDDTDNAEVVGALTLGAGHNIITSSSSVADNVGTLTFASLAARTNRATVLVRGASLGDASALQRGQIVFTSAPSGGNAAVGGGGGAGSTNRSIFPWMVGDSGVAGLGSSFVYDTGTNGLRPLRSVDYINDSTGITGTLTDNIRYTVSAALGSTPVAINSLLLDSSANIVFSGSPSSMEITSGAILAAGSGNHSISDISGLTTGGGRDYIIYVTTPTATLTILTPLTSAVPLVKSGAGTLSLTAAGTGNAFTDLYLNQGAVLANDLDRLGTGVIRFFGGGLRLAGNWTDDLSTKALDINTGGGLLDVSLVTAGVTLVNGLDDTTPNAADVLQIYTRSSGSGTTGLLTIQGASTFIGTTVFNHGGTNSSTAVSVRLQGATNQAINGNVQIGSSGTLVADRDVSVVLGADEQIVDTASITFVSTSGEEAYFKLYGRTETVAGISAAARGVIENFESGTDQVAGNARLILKSSEDFSYTGYIRSSASGTGGTLSLEKQGAGTQTLAGANITYTGTTTIGGGTLRLTNTTGFNSDITNDATLELNSTTAGWTLSKIIGGTGAVVKTGTGTVALAGASTYSGQTTLEQGVLSISAAGNLGDGSATNSVRIANNATLQSTGADVDLGANRAVRLAGTGGTLEVTGTGRLTVSGAVQGDDCHVLTKAGDGVLVLTSTGNGTSFVGATQVGAGTLQVGAAGSGASGAGGITVASGATLAGSGFVTAGTLLNTGAVLQAGDVITAGMAATTVTDLRTLTFTNAGNALTVDNGAQIRLGLGSTATHTSAGVVEALAAGTYTNALAYIAANAGEFALWDVAPVNATDIDFLNLTGSGSTLTIGDRASGTFGNGSVVINGLTGAQAGQVFNLMDWKAVSGILGTFDTGGSAIYDANGDVIAGDLDLAALGAGFGWDVSAFAQYGIIVVVPEPSRAVLLLLGLLGLTLRRHRRLRR